MKITFLIASLLLALSLRAQNRVEVRCDSIYKGKGITIKLETIAADKDGYDGKKNAMLVIEQKGKNRKYVLRKDSIFSTVQEIKFADFNNDHIKDVLIQNISDVRSNWTYYLYLYHPRTNSFTRVIGFEEIKNPKYNSKYHIVESYVVSGQNWVGFYKIINGSAVDLNIQIEEGATFDRDYEEALFKIKAKK